MSSVIMAVIKKYFLSVLQDVAGACLWLLPHPVHDWIYQGPAILVLIVNLIFLSKIMWVSYFSSIYYLKYAKYGILDLSTGMSKCTLEITVVLLSTN